MKFILNGLMSAFSDYYRTGLHCINCDFYHHDWLHLVDDDRADHLILEVDSGFYLAI